MINLTITPLSPNEAMSTIEDAARLVLFASRLLHAILVSGSFQRHIKLLVDQNYLKIPSTIRQLTWIPQPIPPYPALSVKAFAYCILH